MKKIVALIICCVMVVSVLGLYGCSSDTTFNGNYEETNRESAAVFLGEASANRNIDIMRGSEIELRIKETSTPLDAEIRYNFKVAMDENQRPEMSGTLRLGVDIEGLPVSAKFEVYYKDGVLYERARYAIIDITGKVEYDLDEFLTKKMSSNPIDEQGINKIFDYLEAKTEASGGTVKIYTATVGTLKKMKMEFTDFTLDNLTMNGACYFVYDADNNLAAYKMDVKVVIGETETSVYLVVKVFEGEIDLPSDLYSYEQKAAPLV